MNKTKWFFAFLLLGCGQTWMPQTATKQVDVYKNADEKDQIIFSVDQGTTCLLGKETIVKAYKHRQIKCDKGEGWVVYPYHFKKTKNSS
ncbi:hypothetical protein [Limnobacter sp.]|uniref:hypothetical protein n=1 Tax=Limnobacter sp. TaxID=2003368 RepID=UPI002FE0E373